MKQFYSCIDATLPAPQSEQHSLMQNMAWKLHGKIVFYGAEELLVIKEQPFILQKLLSTPNLNGVIFFTFDQFCYSGKINLKLIHEILKNKFSIHFARENLNFLDKSDLLDQFIVLSSYSYSRSRNKIKEVSELNSYLN